MSEQVVTDPLKFARGRQSLEGSLPVASMVRLKDALASDIGTITFRLTGSFDEPGGPSLQCQVSGTLQVVCQRCLTPMNYALDINSALLLMTDERMLQDDNPDAPDRILAQQDLPVADLIEEEILLVLPMAPHHPEGECEAGTTLKNDGRLHPFAALAQLKSVKE